MENVLQHYFGLSPDVQSKLFESIFAILIIFLLQRIIRRFLFTRVQDLKMRYQWQKISLYLAVFLVIVFLLNTWLQIFGSMATFLGLISAGIAIALKDPLVNMVD